MLDDPEISDEARERLIEIGKEITAEQGYPPTTTQLLEYVELVKLWPADDTRPYRGRQHDWNTYAVLYRLYSSDAPKELARLESIHGDTLRAVTPEIVRSDFVDRFGEPRTYRW